MNRLFTYVVGPETAMALLTRLVFVFCARHYSYSPRDVSLLERLLWLLPVITVLVAYATIFVPGAKSWWWLGRVNVALFVALLVCANKVANGFVAPGSGPSAGGFGIFAIFCFAMIFAALANAFAGALILAEHKPGFADSFRARGFLSYLLTALAAVPIFIAMGSVAGLIVGTHVFFSTLFKR